MALASGEVLEIAWLTVQVSALGTLLGALVGIPLGVRLALRPAGTRAFLRTLVTVLYGMPPVVAGLLLYLLLSRSGPLGALGWLFTPAALVIAQFVLAAPLITGLTLAAVHELPPSLREFVRASGVGPARAAWTLVLEARHGVIAAVMVGFGRAISEVAAALLVGGNIRHETRILGTAILQQTGQGDFSAALALGGVLLSLTLLTFLALSRLQNVKGDGA